MFAIGVEGAVFIITFPKDRSRFCFKRKSMKHPPAPPSGQRTEAAITRRSAASIIIELSNII